jgi:hypothetical protein
MHAAGPPISLFNLTVPRLHDTRRSSSLCIFFHFLWRHILYIRIFSSAVYFPVHILFSFQTDDSYQTMWTAYCSYQLANSTSQPRGWHSCFAFESPNADRLSSLTFAWFSSAPHEEFWDNAFNNPLPLPFASIPYRSSVILPSNVM